MEGFSLTGKMMLGARTYLPLEEKMAFVSENAPKCFDRLRITLGDDEAAPPLYKENTGLKSRYLMYALTAKYFGFAVETEEENGAPGELVTADEYDKYAGSHIFGQIKRMTSDTELRDRCFDLLSDYRDLEKRMNAEIAALLAAQNDAVARQQMLTAQSMAQLPTLIEELRALWEKRGEGGEKDAAATA